MKISSSLGSIWSGNPFYMAGTEGTGQYVVILATQFARVGIREYPKLGSGKFRVRIEPSRSGSPGLCRPLLPVLNCFFPTSAGWKQPGQGGQWRYSHEFFSSDTMAAEFAAIVSQQFQEAIGYTAAAVAVGDAVVNSSTEVSPAWARDILDRVATTLAQASAADESAPAASDAAPGGTPPSIPIYPPAHTALADKALRHYGLDAVILVPTPAPSADNLKGLSAEELYAVAAVEGVRGRNKRWGKDALVRNILANRARRAQQ